MPNPVAESMMWAEKTFYADCPRCDAVNKVGHEGDVMLDGSTHTCEECGCEFVLREPET